MPRTHQRFRGARESPAPTARAHWKPFVRTKTQTNIWEIPYSPEYGPALTNRVIDNIDLGE